MAKDWNKAYEIGDTPWDKGYASPPLDSFISKYPIRGSILVPGCGVGYDVRLLALQDVQVVGIDIAPVAIKKAKTFRSVGSERYELGNFLNLESRHVGFYDWVVEHTCLCALEPFERATYVKALKKALKPSGQYLAIFFRKVEGFKGCGPPYPISKLESEALFGQDFEQLRSFVPKQSYPCRPYGAEEVCWMRRK